MKQNARQITVEEAETLCRLYMDCRLTVLEEAELEYVLMKSGVDSPLIRETREVMSVKSLKREKKHTSSLPSHFFPFSPSIRVLWAAASVVIVLGCAVLLRNKTVTAAGETLCIAYSGGKQVSSDRAKDIAEADVARMEQFMQTVAAQRASEEEKVKHFFNMIER